jgi:hypothetical protein
VALPDEILRLTAAEVVYSLTDLYHFARPAAPHGHFLDLAQFVLELELGSLAAAVGCHSVGHVLEIEEADRETGEVALCSPGRTRAVVSAILILSKVDGRLCLVVAGIEDRTVDLASPDPRSSSQRNLRWDIRVHWTVVEVLHLSAVAGLVDHVVDLASRRLLGVHSHSPRLAFRVRSAVVDSLLVCNFAVRNLVEGTLGRTVVRVRRRSQRHCLHNTGQTAGSCHIRNRHIRHAAAVADRSPDRKIYRSRRIAAVAAEDSRHSVFAPEPAGAGRNSFDEELRRNSIGRTPCCRSNGRRSGVSAYVLQSRPIKRASSNGSNGECIFESRTQDRIVFQEDQQGSTECLSVLAGSMGFVPSFEKV